MNIAAASLIRLTREIFVSKGCPADEAERIGTALVGANLAGHDSHGVIRVARYAQYIDDGKIHPGRSPKIVSDAGAMAVLDGDFGFGQSIGPAAVELGLAKAAEHGVAVVALRNSGHLGRIGEYAETAAARNVASVHFVNVAGALLVAPFGGVDRRFSTAPFAAGVPMPDGPPLILDFATSLVAEGKALVAYNGGKLLPEGSLIGPDGSLSADPLLLYGETAGSGGPNPRLGPGALAAMGGHKGSGLAFMCELLAGALTGSGTAGPDERTVCNGMLSVYLPVAAFGDDNAIRREFLAYADFVKSARPAEPGGEVLLPGEPEQRMREARLAEGVPLTDAVWTAILETARGVGMSEAEIETALQAPEGAAAD